MRAVLVKGGKVLFIRHVLRQQVPGKWTFPGGRLEPYETDPIVALRREMHEELSIDIDILGLLGQFYSRSRSDYMLFAARPLSPIGPLQAEEIHDFCWLTPATVYEWHQRDRFHFGFELKAVLLYLRNFRCR